MTDEVFACLSDHCYCAICCWSLSDHCYCAICLLLESVRPLLLCYLSVAGVCQTIVTVLPVCCWSLSDHCYCPICLLLESVRPLLLCYLSVAGVCQTIVTVLSVCCWSLSDHCYGVTFTGLVLLTLFLQDMLSLALPCILIIFNNILESYFFQ